MELDALSQRHPVDLIKEFKQHAMDLLEMVFLAQILQLQLLLMFASIKHVLRIQLQRVMQIVLLGTHQQQELLIVFGEEAQDALIHNLVHHLQEQLIHVLHSRLQMDLVMEQVLLQLQLHVLLTHHFAQVLHLTIVLMHNVRLGVLLVLQMVSAAFQVVQLHAQASYHLLPAHSINQQLVSIAI